MMSHYDIAGIVGVTLGLYAYARLQWHRDYAKKMSYSVFNLIYSLLMLYSLSNNWNLAAVVATCFFGVISLYGIYRCLRYDWRGSLVLKRLEAHKHTSEQDRL